MANELRGMDIIVSVNTGTTAAPVWTAVGGQRNATLNRSAETIETTNKVSAGWKSFITGFKEWSVDCDGLYTLNDTGYAELEDAFSAGELVEIQIAKDGVLNYKGSAAITDFPIEAAYDDVATYSVSFAGVGALVQVTP